MRVFIFAIGGTGSRVLTSMIMQLAAGVRPKDEQGKDIPNLSIVPILVDPHEDNAGLLELTELLDNYRRIRKRIYGDKTDVEGFFSVKIETLKDTNPRSVSSDKFYFKMQRVSENSFEKFINKSEMDLENRLFSDLLFSRSELNTKMREGFYGSPNIGCVALNEFKNSPDFDAFRSAFRYDERYPEQSDKLFFIGSIFGGTGASGLPLFISSIRDLEHEDNEDEGKTNCAKAPIGALVVMPYFSIEADEESPINDVEFAIKTRSALRYYDTNLNRYINNIYYVADPIGTDDFENDPGNRNNQKGNKAHFVEFVGGLSIFDFISDSNVEVVDDNMGRKVAASTKTKAYGLRNDSNYIKFTDLANATNNLCLLPLLKFHILRLFMEKFFDDFLAKPFANKFEPRIEKSVKTRDLESFFKEYDRWIEEMKSHGSNAHNLDLFEKLSGKEFSKLARGISPKRGILYGQKSFNATDILSALNDIAPKYNKMTSADERWFTIANSALEDVVNNNLDYKTLI